MIDCAQRAPDHSIYNDEWLGVRTKCRNTSQSDVEACIGIAPRTRDVKTCNLTLQQLNGVIHCAAVKVIFLHTGYRTGDLLFLLSSIADDHYLVKRSYIRSQRHINRVLVAYFQLLTRIPHK